MPPPRPLTSALTTTPASVPRRESADARLAKNLVAARVIAGLTQHELAGASGVSRATIAQLETGVSDPRLSTVVQLAHALHVSPLLLLIGEDEARALAALRTRNGAVDVPPVDLAKMLEYVETGMLKDRLRAARVGASVARRSAGNASPAVPIAAGILSAILPGPGTVIGAVIGESWSSPPTEGR